MNQKELQLLSEHNWWANGRTLDAVSALTAEQFTRDMGGSYPSVRDTLTHILAAEWIWLMRCRGVSPHQLFDPADFPDLNSIRAKWAEVERGRKDFLASLTAESLETVIAYTNMKGEEWRYPLWQILLQVTHHSAYHRGQVTTMLRQLGAEAVPTDFLAYIDVGTEPA
ncbi:MAG TPA: DinB family protein [Blastocatellia bacterium]|nr:DinB family protein [Blastocatellia bacterium]